MSNIEITFGSTVKKLKYLFQLELREYVKLELLEFYPEFNNDKLEVYEILVEFEILKETDPELDYIFIEIKKNMDRITKFFHEYGIDKDGKLVVDTSNEKLLPVVHGIDFLIGEKFNIKSFFRFNN